FFSSPCQIVLFWRCTEQQTPRPLRSSWVGSLTFKLNCVEHRQEIDTRSGARFHKWALNIDPSGGQQGRAQSFLGKQPPGEKGALQLPHPFSSPRTWEQALCPALLEAAIHFRPVHHLPPSLQVVASAVLVFQVVSVLPHVVAHDREKALAHRIVLVRRAHDLQLATMVADQPRPAAS